jgi:hypothetical protein
MFAGENAPGLMREQIAEDINRIKKYYVILHDDQRDMAALEAFEFQFNLTNSGVATPIVSYRKSSVQRPALSCTSTRETALSATPFFDQGKGRICRLKICSTRFF